MFKLLRGTYKRFRGFSIIGEKPYVSICNFQAENGDMHAAIEISGSDMKDRFILLIPIDRVDSVIERLQECKRLNSKRAPAQ